MLLPGLNLVTCQKLESEFVEKVACNEFAKSECRVGWNYVTFIMVLRKTRIH